MSASALPRMTADEFLDWAMRQPEGHRYELVAGEVVAVAAQRSGHSLISARIATRLSMAVEAKGLQCFVYGDGMAVEIDSSTIFEPDVMLRCGERLPDDALKVTDPLVVVEVKSPSSGARDAGVKLAGYFQLPSLRHYLIVATDIRTMIHHYRDDAGTILTRIVADGAIAFDPPGIEVRDLFG
jgi:Uma2 family endonuclease